MFGSRLETGLEPAKNNCFPDCDQSSSLSETVDALSVPLGSTREENVYDSRVEAEKKIEKLFNTPCLPKVQLGQTAYPQRLRGSGKHTNRITFAPSAPFMKSTVSWSKDSIIVSWKKTKYQWLKSGQIHFRLDRYTGWKEFVCTGRAWSSHCVCYWKSRT